MLNNKNDYNMKIFLAIRGNYTRGNEVIKILENLGGTNKKNLDGNEFRYFYFINLDGIIDCVFEERMLITQWETHTIDSYNKKYSKPNPNFIYKKNDVGKELNAEFNEIYNLISDVDNMVDTFYTKHILYNKDVDVNSDIFSQMSKLQMMMSEAKCLSHYIAEYFTWDN